MQQSRQFQLAPHVTDVMMTNYLAVCEMAKSEYARFVNWYLSYARILDECERGFHVFLREYS